MNDFLQSLRNNQAEKPRSPKTRKNYDNSYQYSSGPRFNSYGGNGYPNTRNPQMKRQPAPGIPHPSAPPMQGEDQGMTLLADAIDTLSTQVDTLVKNQEYLITVQERTADLLQRQADAIEIVMAHLNMSPDMPMPAPPAFENHYISSQEPEEEIDGTVEELLKAELEEERKKQEAIAAKPVLRKRRKVVSKPVQKTAPTPPRTPAAVVASSQPKSDAELLPREVVMGIIDSMREEGATYDQVAKRLIDLGQPTFSGRGEWHAQTIHRLCSKK